LIFGVQAELLVDVHPDCQRRIGVHLLGDLLGGLASQAHLHVGQDQLGLLRCRMLDQLVTFHGDLGTHRVVLGLHRGVFPERHREGTRHQPGHAGQHDQVGARTAAAHARDQRDVGHQAVHRAEHGWSQPSSGYVSVDVPDLIARLDSHHRTSSAPE
jgi:hypothetical protein